MRGDDNVVAAMLEGTPVHVEQTERSFSRLPRRRWKRHPVGLIELITNCDDQYGDQPGSIRVRFPKPEPEGSTWEVQVRDKASGIAYEDIEPKLPRFGGRTSGHERGERKRGNRGRGAKDVSHFGQIRWDMFKDGKYRRVWLDRHGRGEKSARRQRADQFREEFGVPRNGVVAT